MPSSDTTAAITYPRPIGGCLPFLPGLLAPPDEVAAPKVWRGSTTASVAWRPEPQREKMRRWRRIRRFDGQGHRKGHHGGIIGTTAMAVAHSLIFDFYDYRTGRLDPAKSSIAKATKICERAVADALTKLRDLGVIRWIRRCRQSIVDGRHVLEQDTNAYSLRPEAEWRGFRPMDPPLPEHGTWGAPDPMAVPTGSLTATADFLEAEADGPVNAALASFARTFAERDLLAERRRVMEARPAKS
jgi:hypothetical protein